MDCYMFAFTSFCILFAVVALATFCATIVPRSHLLAEAVTQGTFMAAMYQLFCLLVAYCGGEAELIRRVKPTTLKMKVGPCCCWPCCFLPSLEMTKNRVRQLRILVLQLPVIQGLIYMTLLVMWAERESLYQINYMYVQPVVVVSILFGIWGMTMTITLLKDVLKDHSLQAKFLVLQMVLLFAKLQGLATRIIVWAGLLPCKPPITSAVYGNLIHNTLMLLEMVLLSVIARRLYKRPLPDLDATPSVTCPPSTVWTTNLKEKALHYFTRKEKNNNVVKEINQQKAVDQTENAS
ncbi:organic solute transporter alpha-like protein [Agrilus planipennis]|uniref:Organic solute transporter alpha-like protein n=1 Tax=Agrilus planipennis TaxID=224129 RepID=A0A1W4XGR7_AGRPL|nr:organic solute transporter alpha-like protein [Agrilus planipennis]